MYKSIVQLVCLTILSWHLASSSYIDLPWADPCGGANPVPGTEGQGGTGETLDINETLKAVTTSAIETMVFARVLKTRYNSDPNIRISNDNAASLESETLNLFPHNRTSLPDMEVALQRDYDHVSTIAVFMENVHQNERTSTSVNKLTREMEDLESSLYATLCKIKIAADARGQSLEVNIGRDVMNATYKNMSPTAVRYMRDYIIFRDSEKFLKELSEGY